MANGTETRRRIPRAEREARMLDAAEIAFAEHGFAGASMDSIATESGITKALLYQYFGSKEGLYTACVERARLELFDRIVAAAEQADGAVERLMKITEIYFDDLLARRGSVTVLYGDAPRAAVDQMRERNADTIAHILRLDYPEAADDAVALVAHLIVGAGEQVGRWWTRRPEVPVDEVRARFARLIGTAVASELR